MNIRVYLAGPEVFLSNARTRSGCTQASHLCERQGLVGVFPADEEDGFDRELCRASWVSEPWPSAAPWNVSCRPATP